MPFIEIQVELKCQEKFQGKAISTLLDTLSQCKSKCVGTHILGFTFRNNLLDTAYLVPQPSLPASKKTKRSKKSQAATEDQVSADQLGKAAAQSLSLRTGGTLSSNDDNLVHPPPLKKRRKNTEKSDSLVPVILFTEDNEVIMDEEEVEDRPPTPMPRLERQDCISSIPVYDGDSDFSE